MDMISAGNGIEISEENIVLFDFDQSWKAPAEEPSANDELEQIVKEYKVADFLSEIARYRIWRLHKTGNWKNILDSSGVQKYSLWEDVIIDLSELLHCGRQQLFDRVRVYEQLYWLGYSAEDSIRMISDRPYLYTRALTMLMDWDQKKEQPRAIAVPEMASATREEATDYIKGLLEDINSFETQKEAVRYISENILLEPQVDIWYDGDLVHVKYFSQKEDENGLVEVDEYGEILFYPNADMPNWVKEKVISMFKSVGKYSNAAKKAGD